jgi:hypothetical protein
LKSYGGMPCSANGLFHWRGGSRKRLCTRNSGKRITNICRRVDGIPLAIEMAAGRRDVFGIAGLAGVLNDRFRRAMRGRRTAVPRHQTLSTTLESFANLVVKSLLVVNPETPVATCRQLETMRAYAPQKLEENGEPTAYARRHARQCLAAIETANAEWETSPPQTWLARHRHLIDDVRAALDLSFRAVDETAIQRLRPGNAGHLDPACVVARQRRSGSSIARYGGCGRRASVKGPFARRSHWQRSSHPLPAELEEGDPDPIGR